MDLKFIAGILGVTVMAVGIGLLIPSGEPLHKQSLPWQIEATVDGSIRVLGLSLGESTLQDAEQEFQAEADIGLFEAVGEEQTVEAYFDYLNRGGLSAKIVLLIDLSTEQKQVMYRRGTRINQLGDGRYKIALHGEDLILARHSPVISMVYLPRIKLPVEIIEKRFGQPSQRIQEADSKTMHWLYPHFGLDIALDEQGNTVLQYIHPQQFSQLVKPLQ